MRKLLRPDIGFPVAVVLAGLLAGTVYLSNAVRYDFPLGYAGLYSLMAERIYEGGVALPSSLPFYGPGGIPAALPPLGPLLSGLFVYRLGIPLFSYLRFAPPVLTITGLALLFDLFRRILGSPTAALIGVILSLSSPQLYALHSTASGEVRALALLVCLAGLILSWKALRTPERSWIALVCAAGFFGLTILSHLAYGLFFVISVVAFGAMRVRSGRQEAVLRVSLILLGGVALSSLWWISIGTRHGFGVFVAAFSTHGTLGGQAAMSQAAAMIQHFRQLPLQIWNSWNPPTLAGLGILGLSYGALRRRWILPFWFILTAVILGEADRFLIPLAAMAAASLIVELPTQLGGPADHASIVPRVAYTAGIAALLFLSVYQGFLVIRATEPALSPEVLDLAHWMRGATDADAEFLLASDDHDLAEWLPFLLGRTPVVSPWGAEWTGDYDAQRRLSDALDQCAATESLECIEGLLPETQTSELYGVVPRLSANLVGDFAGSRSWAEAYRNDGYLVFQREP